MTKLFILRHGNTFDKGDIVTRVGGRTDLPLSSSGRAQAAAIATTIAKRRPKITRILSSPLSRTMQTATIVRDTAAPGAEIERLEALREIDYGPDENKPEDEVITRVGEEAIALWDADGVPPPGWRVDPPTLTAAWTDLFRRCAQSAGDVLIVTSNGVARFALDAAAIVPEGTPRKLKTAAFGVIALGPEGEASVLEWNVRA
ncbi:MAG: histidine phosphatase family protein [Pseudomonadota bacterium]